MINRNKYIKPIKRVRRHMVLATVLMVIGSVMMFALVEYFVYKIMGREVYDPIDAIGMIVPMGIIFVLFNNRVLQNANRYFSQMINGISTVAEGEFGVELDTDGAGPFKEVFINFNKMSRELQGVQTLRDDFVNQFSHEFKTPVMSINGFAEILLAEELPRDEQIQYLKIIATESKRLGDLSKNTLLLAKLESQQLILNKQPYSLDEQLKQCLILLEPEWAGKELDITVNLESVFWFGNDEIMKQLWINLLSNAIEHTPPKGQISLTLTTESSNRVIRLEDTGDGINSEDLTEIFKKYYKAGNNTSGKGLGLGLSIAKKIVDLCDGRIEVTSRRDEGSVFSVYLPTGE